MPDAERVVQLGTLLAIKVAMAQLTSIHLAWFLCAAGLVSSSTAMAQAPATDATDATDAKDSWTDTPASPPTEPAAPPTAAEGDAPATREREAPKDAGKAPAGGDSAAPPAAAVPGRIAVMPAPAAESAPVPEATPVPESPPVPAATAAPPIVPDTAGAPSPKQGPRDGWGDAADRFEYQSPAVSPRNTFGFGLLGMGMDASPDGEAEPTTRFIAGGFLGRLRASAFLGSSYNEDHDKAHLQYGLSLGMTNGTRFRMSPSVLVIHDQERNSTGIFGYLPVEWVGDTIVGGMHIGFGRWSGQEERYHRVPTAAASSADGPSSSYETTRTRKEYGSEPAFTLMGVVGARFGEDVAPLTEPRTSLPENEMFIDYVLAPITIMDGDWVAAMSSGLQVGAFFGPIRVTAQAMVPLVTDREQLSVMDSLVFGGSVGFSLRSEHFAFSPGVKVLHFGGATAYEETELFLTFPFEWTLTNGYRLGFAYDTFSVTQQAINFQLQFGAVF